MIQALLKYWNIKRPCLRPSPAALADNGRFLLATMRLSRPSPYLLLTLTQLFWAGNWIVGRAIRGDVPPVTLAFWRWVLALALFLPLAWPHLRESGPILRAYWRRLIALGALGAGLYNALSYIGLTYTTATNGVILNSFCPILIIALSWAFFGKRLHRLEAAGVAVSLVGVLLIVMRADPSVLLLTPWFGSS